MLVVHNRLLNNQKWYTNLIEAIENCRPSEEKTCLENFAKLIFAADEELELAYYMHYASLAELAKNRQGGQNILKLNVEGDE